jgi:pimeloyl-ACP methyl ester carboxylesterase
MFWFETLRALGHASYGGADPGEVLTIAQRITPRDYESWHREWLAGAERIAAEAAASESADHHVSARDGWLRASNYYRCAEFFLHGNPDDPRIAYTYERSVSSFRKAARLAESAIVPVQIPYENTSLQGYFYSPLGAVPDGPRPTIVMHTGFDGTAEEMHFCGARAGAERGYNVLTFDGPGHAAARFRDGLVFRPDWENVVKPVIDWLLRDARVDSRRIALLGLSMGGVLAPRAAAFEPRLAACVAVDGVFDLGEVSVARIPTPRAEAEAMLRAPQAPELDAALDAAMAADPQARWAVTHGNYSMGTRSARAFLARYLDFTLAGGIAEKIKCPTLVCEAEADIFFPGQPKELYEHLTCPKHFLRFREDEGAGAHCHFAAQHLAQARILALE